MLNNSVSKPLNLSIIITNLITKILTDDELTLQLWDMNTFQIAKGNSDLDTFKFNLSSRLPNFVTK